MPVISPQAKSGHAMVEISSTFHMPETRRLLEYWQSKRGQRPRLRLNDLDLMEIYDIAPLLTIRDVVDGGREFRSRYWGTQLVNLFGVETTGKLLGEAFSPESAQVLKDRLCLSLQADGPVRVVAVVELIKINVPRIYEGIWLTLDGNGGENQHTIGTFGFGYEFQPGELDREGGPEDWPRIYYRSGEAF